MKNLEKFLGKIFIILSMLFIAGITLSCKMSSPVPETYTITFNMNDGTSNPLTKTQSIQGNNTITLTTISSLGFERIGYDFSGWNTSKDGNGTNYSDGANITISQNITLYAKWNPKSGIKYTVKHYQQNIEDDNYTLVEADTEILTGVTDEKTKAVAKSYTGFEAKSFSQEKICADGSTVIEIYYDRNIIILSFNANGGSWLDGTTNNKSISGKYGAIVVAPQLPFMTGFVGHWNSEIQTVFSKNESYEIIWVENTKVQYCVTYMLQTIDGTKYEEGSVETFYGFIGELTEVKPIEMKGFILPSQDSIIQKTITADGKTSVLLYYDRNTITLTFKSNGQRWYNRKTEDIIITGLYGATVMYSNSTQQATPWLLKKEGFETVFDKPVQTIFLYDESYTASYSQIIANYTVNHWQENINDTDYTLFETEILNGLAGNTTQAVVKEYVGFEKPIRNPNYKKTIAEDGSTEINIYYQRAVISITFSANGGKWSDGTVSDKTINGKYGSDISESLIPIPIWRDDYKFISWNEPLPTVFESNATYIAEWGFPSKYKVRHWKQNIDDDEYTLVSEDTQTFTGTSGFQTDANPKKYEGFTEKTIEQKIIQRMDRTIVDIYYDRDIITLTFISSDSTIIRKGKYGANVLVPIVTRPNYSFDGWYNNWGEHDGYFEDPHIVKVQNTYEHEETYKANWKEGESEKYIITFKTNGGIGEDIIQEFSYRNEFQNLKKNTFTNSLGYYFSGWSNNPNVKKDDTGVFRDEEYNLVELYTNEEIYYISENNILYAIWSAVDVTADNICVVIKNPELYVNGVTIQEGVKEYYSTKYGATSEIIECDYKIKMTGDVSQETINAIKQVCDIQKEKTICLDMGKTKIGFGDTLEGHSFVDINSGTLKALYLPEVVVVKSEAFVGCKIDLIKLNIKQEIYPKAFIGCDIKYCNLHSSVTGNWYYSWEANHNGGTKLSRSNIENITYELCNESGKFSIYYLYRHQSKYAELYY